VKIPAAFLTALLAGLLPLHAQPVREIASSGLTVQLQGVSDEMVAPARLVLEKQLALSGDPTVSAPLADDLAFFLQQRYLQLGYPRALVDWKLTGPAAILSVQEGQRRTMGSVTFTGVPPDTADTLRPYLTRQTREREGRLAKALPFVESDLEAGLGLVVRKLQADGYLQARAAPPVFNEDAVALSNDIAIALTPGPISRFGPVSVLGDATALSKASQEKIRALPGQPWSEVKLENLRKDVKGDLEARGWFAAAVTTAIRPPTETGVEATLASSLTISPGQRFTVASVTTDETKPLSRGAQRVARSVFDSALHQAYDPEVLDLLHRRSMDTGIFSRLEVEPQPLGPDTLALRISGTEAKPKTLGLFGGYETFYGPIAGIEARHVNFMDTGNSLGLRAELRGTGANGSLQWSDPALFGSRNAFGLALELETFTFKDYSRSSLSLHGSLTRRLNRHITAEAFSSITVNLMDTAVLTPEELGPDQYGTLSAGGRLTLDFRDNPLNPKSGWLAGAALEGGFDQGGEEDIGFARTDLNGAWYQPLGGAWRIALGARASAIRNSGTPADLPIDLRLFNGGGTTVRSFAERDMGASSASGSTPLGGTAITVMNAELSYEIISHLEIAGFIDAGSISRDDSALFSTDDLRYGVGLGVRYQLPIGPLRMDYGYNPDRHPGEAAGAFHLTFGFAF
jgi:outer membrane protein assembly factor BamA